MILSHPWEENPCLPLASIPSLFCLCSYISLGSTEVLWIHGLTSLYFLTPFILFLNNWTETTLASIMGDWILRLHFSRFWKLSMISFLKKKKKYILAFVMQFFLVFPPVFLVTQFLHKLTSSFWTSVHLHELQGLCKDLSFIQASGFVPHLEVVTPNPYLQVITLSHRSDLHVTEKQEHKAAKRLENVIISQIQIFTLHLLPLWPGTSYQPSLGLSFISGKMRVIIVYTSTLSECNISN